MRTHPRRIDLLGVKFGRWTVEGQSGNTKRGGTVWRCRCDCGQSRDVIGADLRAGKSLSCGCLKAEAIGGLRRTHGDSGSKLHEAWKNMRGRCLNPRRAGYENYGGRGISICAQWDDFEAFRDWALLAGYRAGLTIERIDVNGNYEPANCTWIPASDQSVNRRFVQKAPDGELWWHKAQRNGITNTAYRQRILAGWSYADAISRPMNTRRFKRERNDKGQFA